MRPGSTRSRSTSPSCNAKLLTPDDFPNLNNLAERLTAFEHRYNDAARPFDWRFGVSLMRQYDRAGCEVTCSLA